MDFDKLVQSIARLQGQGRRGLIALGIAFAALALITLAGLKNAILTGGVLVLAFVVLALVVWAARIEGSSRVSDPVPPEPVLPLAQLQRVIVDSLEPPRRRTLPGPNNIQVNEYVNFRSSCGVENNLRVLVNTLSAKIRDSLDLDNWDAVVIPMRGNVLLGTGVAAALGLQPILVRDSPIEGKWVESPISRGRAFLVDDVCAEGMFLLDIAEKAREAGFPPSRAFLLIERTEGNARDALNQHSIELTAFLTMGDLELASLRDRIRRAG